MVKKKIIFTMCIVCLSQLEGSPAYSNIVQKFLKAEQNFAQHMKHTNPLPKTTKKLLQKEISSEYKWNAVLEKLKKTTNDKSLNDYILDMYKLYIPRA